MPVKNSHIIDVEAFQSLSNFEWFAKIIASGFMHGKHNSRRLGTGNEFQQYRPYVAGDDIRGVDWKMYARTNKFYIKQTNIDTEHSYLFLLDDSLSMNYLENGWTKLMMAKMIMASMLRVVANQGDQFGWQSGNSSMPVGTGMRHWQHCVEQLYFTEGGSEGDIFTPVKHDDSTIIWISDFYMSPEKIETQLKRLASPRIEVLLFHILGKAEIDLSFGNNSTFIDLETREQLNVNAAMARKSYTEKLSKHIGLIKNTGFEYGAAYTKIGMETPIVEVLRSFFHHYQYSKA